MIGLSLALKKLEEVSIASAQPSRPIFLRMTTSNGASSSADVVPSGPLDMIEKLLLRSCLIKCRNGKELRGKLQAYDQHLNVLLGEVEERSFEGPSSSTRTMEMLYVRGDAITMITTS